MSQSPPDAEIFSRRARCRWTPEEDSALLKAVEAHGANNWDRISALIGTRKDWQCRERWHNHLKPDVKKSSFTPADDSIILNGVRSLGRRWAQIASYMPGRSPNAVKNRYHQLCRAGGGTVAPAATVRTAQPTGFPVVAGAPAQLGGPSAAVQMIVMPDGSVPGQTAAPVGAAPVQQMDYFRQGKPTNGAWPVYAQPQQGQVQGQMQGQVQVTAQPAQAVQPMPQVQALPPVQATQQMAQVQHVGHQPYAAPAPAVPTTYQATAFPQAAPTGSTWWQPADGQPQLASSAPLAAYPAATVPMQSAPQPAFSAEWQQGVPHANPTSVTGVPTYLQQPAPVGAQPVAVPASTYLPDGAQGLGDMRPTALPMRG